LEPSLRRVEDFHLCVPPNCSHLQSIELNKNTTAISKHSDKIQIIDQLELSESWFNRTFIAVARAMTHTPSVKDRAAMLFVLR
jgi:hypothetical protein